MPAASPSHPVRAGLVDRLLADGVAAFNGGRAAEAEKAFTRALRLAPRRGDLYQLRCMARQALGRRGPASRDLRSALKAQPRSAALRSWAGEVLRGWEAERARRKAAELDRRAEKALRQADLDGSRGAWRKALAALKRAAALRPRDPQAPLKAAILLKDSGQALLALRSCRTALRLDPGSREARELLEAVLAAVVDGDPPARFLEKIEALVESGRYGAALELSRRAAQGRGRGSWQLHWQKAKLEAALGLRESSLRSMRRAAAGLQALLRLAPEAVPARLRCADALELVGDFRGALRHAARAAAAQPGAVPAESRLARLSLWAGDWKTARAGAGRVLAAAPSDPDALRVRGAAGLLGGELRSAKADLDAALALRPADPETLVWRAELARRGGRFGDCLEDLDRAARLSAASPGAAVNRILAKLGLGQGPEPELSALRRRLPKALASRLDAAAGQAALKRGLEDVLLRLGGGRGQELVWLSAAGRLERHLPKIGREALLDLQARLRLGDADAVLEEFARRLRAEPRNAQAYSCRGELRLWLGDYEQAREDLSRARELDPYLKWPGVGLAAVSLMRGELLGALEGLDRAAAWGASPAVLSVWRGETLRRLGRPKEALEFLAADAAVRLRPSTLANMGLALGAAGDAEGRDRTLERLREACPAFLSEVLRAAGLDSGPQTGARAAAALEQALRMMRGNRSSWMHTYFSRSGRLRNIGVRAADRP